MIAIIDYRAGNLTSVKLAFEAIGADAVITSDSAKIREADRILFPGVGAAGSAMHNLKESGLINVLRERVDAGVPFLGICLGTQILFDRSAEDGGVDCMGFLPGDVRKFEPTNRWDKIPEIGWNQVAYTRQHPLLEGIPENSDFYFVHSYYTCPNNASDIIGLTEYAGLRFASMVGRANIAATQFHPEKSGKLGLRLLKNFTTWN